ncbi:MAG: hypothetical protein WC881_11170 [Elusimicrobiota bacterium]|jgi:hypothetical protein
MNKKGYVLIHVLVISMVVAVIAAGIMRMLMLRQTMILRNTEGVSARKNAEGHFNAIMSAWNSAPSPNAGLSCSAGAAIAALGYSIVTPGTLGGCNCKYSKTDYTATAVPYLTTIVARGGTPCRLDMISAPVPAQ